MTAHNPRTSSAAHRSGIGVGVGGGLVVALVLLNLVLFSASLAIGPRGLFGVGPEGTIPDPGTFWIVVREIRLPRVLLAFLVGAMLGLAGAVLQGFLRNPLAEPSLVGASSMGALGAVIALYSGLASWFTWALPVGGILGAVTGLFIVLVLAGGSGGILSLILAGVAVNAFAGALTALVLNLSPSPYAALEIVFWMLGSVTDRSMEDVCFALPFMVAGTILMFSVGRGLDALSLGESTAASLGFDLYRLRVLAVLGVGLSVGAGVAVAGNIGFVGLVVPHILRALVGSRPGALLGVSALGGGALLMGADIVVRLAATEAELKLGVVTALIGAPFFLYLLIRMRGSLW